MATSSKVIVKGHRNTTRSEEKQGRQTKARTRNREFDTQNKRKGKPKQVRERATTYKGSKNENVAQKKPNQPEKQPTPKKP